MVGCAAPKQLSRDEWLTVTTRHYASVTKEEVLLAAEKLFGLADGNDFQFFHAEEGLMATRNWLVYMVLAAASGTDYWKIQVATSNNGVDVTAQVNTSAQGVTPMPTTGGAWTATTMPMAGSPVQGTAIYDVFWARLDYLLGKRTDWMTCKEANKRVGEKITWGDNSALCNSFNVADKSPQK